MYCTKCGNEIKEGNKFCTNCGTNINENVDKKKKIKIKLNNILILILIIIIFIFIICKFPNKENNTDNKKQIIETTNNDELKLITELRLNNLKFEVKIKSNSDMEVTEIWNIDIKDTNTLFKTFKLDNKYAGISNVKVSEKLANGELKEFTQIDTEMYHVTKDCYYALINSNNDFEIAWGIDEKNTSKTYLISYTVNNAIHVYNDCAELYWQYIGNDNAIPIDNISGNIYIENLKEVSNVKMWGHSKMEVSVTSNNNCVRFEAKDFKKGNYLEIRLLLPKDIFNTNNIDDREMLSQILSEENNNRDVDIIGKNNIDVETFSETSNDATNLLEQIYEKYPELEGKDGIICSNINSKYPEYWLLDKNGKKMYFSNMKEFEILLQDCPSAQAILNNQNSSNIEVKKDKDSNKPNETNNTLEYVNIPYLVGLTEQQAIDKIKNLSIPYEISYREKLNKTEGIVLEQSYHYDVITSIKGDIVGGYQRSVLYPRRNFVYIC